mmetsp:Transcript_4027/g.10029  ORF Transcript_4027/g.10029 Transcript_4027/m.10029 type:complete len:298 (-) Transcript_4027:173-1066(-)
MSIAAGGSGAGLASSMHGPNRKLRVLCLHSFRTSASIFKQQMAKARLDASLADLVELVYVDAPNPASGQIPRDVAPFFEGPYYEWTTVERVGDKLEFAEEKMERSIATVAAALRAQGPFDGLVGFSQGAIMASSLVALQRAGEALQDIPPLKFCVLFAGMRSKYPGHAAAFSQKVSVPSLHVFGDRDELKHPHCLELADAFANPIVISHTRGHVIPPLDGYQLACMRAFLTSFQTAELASLAFQGSGITRAMATGTAHEGLRAAGEPSNAVPMVGQPAQAASAHVGQQASLPSQSML